MPTRKSRRRGRTPSGARSVQLPAPPVTRPAYPRGNAHTDWVAITDADGTSWLCYVEPVTPEESFRRSAAVLPGRRLRFDSLERSLCVSSVPAGAPFLSEARLHQLLAEAGPLVASPGRARPVVGAGQALRSVDWGASLAGVGAALREAAVQQWRSTAELRRLCTRGLVHLVAPAALFLIVLWEALQVRSRARI